MPRTVNHTTRRHQETVRYENEAEMPPILRHEPTHFNSYFFTQSLKGDFNDEADREVSWKHDQSDRRTVWARLIDDRSFRKAYDRVDENPWLYMEEQGIKHFTYEKRLRNDNIDTIYKWANDNLKPQEWIMLEFAYTAPDLERSTSNSFYIASQPDCDKFLAKWGNDYQHHIHQKLRSLG